MLTLKQIQAMYPKTRINRALTGYIPMPIYVALEPFIRPLLKKSVSRYSIVDRVLSTTWLVVPIGLLYKSIPPAIVPPRLFAVMLLML